MATTASPVWWRALVPGNRRTAAAALGLLCAVTAHADEPSIEYVSAGSTVRAEVPSFLLPESKYDTCLLKARELSILEGYVDALRVEVVAPLQGCQVALKELSLIHI